MHYLIAENSPAFAQKFLELYRGDEVIAVADSNRYEADLKALTKKIHKETKLILFTSGTEGKVKFVQLSRKNIEANTQAVIESLKFKDAREQFLFLPLYYSFGLLGQLLPALEHGIPTHFVNGMMGLRGEKLRGMLSAVGSQWDVLVKLLGSGGPYPDVTHVVSAGSRLSRPTREALHKIFPKATLFNNYGQTECSPRILSLSSAQPGFFSDDTGYPVAGIEVRLGDEAELQVRGPQVMLGYLGDDASTKQKIKDGWLRTGDQASIAADGRVTIQGRTDDLIKLGGERVSLLTFSQCALELNLAKEAVAVQYIDAGGIDRVALVLGVGDQLGRQTEAGTIARIKKGLVGKSAIHISPSSVLFLKELPKLPNGKIDRNAAKAMVGAQVFGARV